MFGYGRPVYDCSFELMSHQKKIHVMTIKTMIMMLPYEISGVIVGQAILLSPPCRKTTVLLKNIGGSRSFVKIGQIKIKGKFR